MVLKARAKRTKNILKDKFLTPKQKSSRLKDLGYSDEELEFILQEGEGLKIEFKEGSGNIDGEIVAFANTEGGRIFLGVGDD